MNRHKTINVISYDAEIALDLLQVLRQHVDFNVVVYDNFKQYQDIMLGNSGDVLLVCIPPHTFHDYMTTEANLIDESFVVISRTTPIYESMNNLSSHLKGIIIWPFVPGQLLSNIHMIIQQSLQERIISKGNMKYMVCVRDFFFAKKEGHYLRLYFREKEEIIRMSITEFIQQMNCSFLAQTHRSYLVNIQHIKRIKSQSVQILNQEVPVSRSFKNELRIQCI